MHFPRGNHYSGTPFIKSTPAFSFPSAGSVVHTFPILTFLSDWLLCLYTRKSAPSTQALHLSEPQHPVHEGVLTLGKRIHYSHLVDGELRLSLPLTLVSNQVWV